MDNRTPNPLASIKSFVWPVDEKRGGRVLSIVLLMAGILAWGLMYVPEHSRAYAVWLIMLLFVLAVVIGVRTVVLSRHRYARDAQIMSYEVAGSGTDEAYQTLDYSSIVVERPWSRNDALTSGVFAAGGAGVLFLVLLVALWPAVQHEAGIALAIMCVLLILPSLWVLLRHRKSLFGREKNDYSQFARANKFTLRDTPDLSLVRDLTEVEKLNTRGKAAFKVDIHITGHYQGYKFALSQPRFPAVRPADEVRGVLTVNISLLNTQKRTQFEDAAHVIGYVDAVEYVPGRLYVIMHAGIPSDRASMIKLFQTFDAAIAAAS